jgi:nitroimidazol reductase NimA-like FMN-containing flavoprotein (pyridoxamine 5'-phosphate oxidase superfamily)
MEVDRNGLEVLDRSECLRLLRSATVGRLGITTGALPTVLPINFRLVGERIVFRTSSGSKLQAATANAVVAFEVDDMDPMWHSGWSVVVTGVAREVTDAEELDALADAHIPRWAPNRTDRVVEISTEILTGRRIVHTNAGSAHPGSGLRHPPLEHGARRFRRAQLEGPPQPGRP